jgi:hypothetical protein
MLPRLGDSLRPCRRRIEGRGNQGLTPQEGKIRGTLKGKRRDKGKDRHTTSALHPTARLLHNERLR